MRFYFYRYIFYYSCLCLANLSFYFSYRHFSIYYFLSLHTPDIEFTSCRAFWSKSWARPQYYSIYLLILLCLMKEPFLPLHFSKFILLYEFFLGLEEFFILFMSLVVLSYANLILLRYNSFYLVNKCNCKSTLILLSYS